MRPSNLEAWVLRIVDAFRSHAPLEDSRVELKSEWPDPRRSARQLAGHANAAGGDQILWIIGLDEARGVIGTSHEEFSQWYAQVQAQFESLAPSVLDLNVPVEGKFLVALLFDTERAPFVVKNPRYGTDPGVHVQCEVPWREARSTRSATRADLIRILVPASSLPEVELLSSDVTVHARGPAKDAPPSSFTWHLEMRLYFVPRRMGDALVIPFHRCEAAVHVRSSQFQLPLSELRISPPQRWAGQGRDFYSVRDSLTIDSTSSEVIITGPGILSLTANSTTSTLGCDPTQPLSAMASLTPVGIGSPLRVSIDLVPSMKKQENLAAKWAYVGPMGLAEENK